MINAGDSLWWVAGGLRFGEESLIKSPDQGESWEMEAQTIGQSWFDGCFLDNQQGYLSGISGKVLRSGDGGTSWQVSQVPFWLPMRSITATEDVAITVGGVAYDQGVIARSVDQGLIWQIVDTPEVELRDVVFVNPTTVYACGFGTILKSEDAGLTWELLPVAGEFFTAMAFTSPEAGVAVGRTGTIMRTLDGGAQWETIRNGDALSTAQHFYNQVVFWDEETGYIVGDKGLVLQTSDGGDHWQPLINEIEDDLYDILLIGPQQGYVVGDNGCMFRFTF